MERRHETNNVSFEFRTASVNSYTTPSWTACLLLSPFSAVSSLSSAIVGLLSLSLSHFVCTLGTSVSSDRRHHSVGWNSGVQSFESSGSRQGTTPPPLPSEPSPLPPLCRHLLAHVLALSNHRHSLSSAILPLQPSAAILHEMLVSLFHLPPTLPLPPSPSFSHTPSPSNAAFPSFFILNVTRPIVLSPSNLSSSPLSPTLSQPPLTLPSVGLQE